MNPPKRVATKLIPLIAVFSLIGAGLLVFFIMLGISMSKDVRVVRKVPMQPIVNLADTPHPDSNVFRLRCLNTHCLPWLRPRAHPDLYTDVDGVVFQELFRTPSLLCSDAMHVVSAPNVQLAAVETAQRKGKLMDSGLAAAAVQPWRVTYVASSPLPGGESFDALADKRVAVFAFTRGMLRIVVATTHLQAFYTRKASARNQALRARQFQHVLEFAVAHGADILAGDVNTPEPALLAQYDEWVQQVGGYRAASDTRPTSQHPLKYFDSWRVNPSSWGSQLDFMWVLRPDHVRPLTLVTANYDVALSWTDHAALDARFEII